MSEALKRSGLRMPWLHALRCALVVGVASGCGPLDMAGVYRGDGETTTTSTDISPGVTNATPNTTERTDDSAEFQVRTTGPTGVWVNVFGRAQSCWLPLVGVAASWELREEFECQFSGRSTSGSGVAEASSSYDVTYTFEEASLTRKGNGLELKYVATARQEFVQSSILGDRRTVTRYAYEGVMEGERITDE
jgi:hypothetical protein